MSKRSISRKININQANFPLPESSNLPNSIISDDKCIQEIYFGEKVNNDSTSCSSNTSEQFHSSFDVSFSGGSTSGEDDLEIETTKRISKEFEKVDNILYGDQDITSDDKSIEYNQWTEKFPHLRVVGSAMQIHPCPEDFLIEIGDGDFEETIAEHYDCPCNVNSDKQYNKSKIKETVINSVLKEVSTKLLKKRRDCKITINSGSKRKTRPKLPNYQSIDVEINEIIPTSENILQVTASAMPIHGSPFHKPNFEYQSPIMKSHLSASKWQRHDSMEFGSLPHLIPNVPYSQNDKRTFGPCSGNRSEIILSRSPSTISRKYSDSVNRTQSNKYLSTPRNNIVLPPIQNLNLEVEKERAASETPRKLATKYKCRVSSNLNRK